MSAFPFQLPLNGFAALGNGLTEISGVNYFRMPTLIELTADGVTASNEDTIEWCIAGNDWGPVTSVLIYDAPTGGNLLFMALLAGTAVPYSWENYSVGLYSPAAAAQLTVHKYDRPRVSASAIAAVAIAGVPIGFGTGKWGRYAYETAPVVEGTVSNIFLTFGTTSLCQAGTATWTPGPCACDCIAA